MDKLINISELSKKLNLINKINNKPQNHTIRFWEKKFKQIKPKIINKRRYFNQEQVGIVEKINFLLKIKGMTIIGAQNLLNNKINKLDDYNSDSLKAEYYKKQIKIKSKTILNKIKKLRTNGKKNSP